MSSPDAAADADRTAMPPPQQVPAQWSGKREWSAGEGEGDSEEGQLKNARHFVEMPSEDEKRERRLEQNRLAAKRSYNKRVQKQAEMEEEYEKLRQELAATNHQIATLGSFMAQMPPFAHLVSDPAWNQLLHNHGPAAPGGGAMVEAPGAVGAHQQQTQAQQQHQLELEYQQSQLQQLQGQMHRMDHQQQAAAMQRQAPRAVTQVAPQQGVISQHHAPLQLQAPMIAQAVQGVGQQSHLQQLQHPQLRQEPQPEQRQEVRSAPNLRLLSAEKLRADPAANGAPNGAAKAASDASREAGGSQHEEIQKLDHSASVEWWVAASAFAGAAAAPSGEYMKSRGGSRAGSRPAPSGAQAPSPAAIPAQQQPQQEHRSRGASAARAGAEQEQSQPPQQQQQQLGLRPGAAGAGAEEQLSHTLTVNGDTVICTASSGVSLQLCLKCVPFNRWLTGLENKFKLKQLTFTAAEVVVGQVVSVSVLVDCQERESGRQLPGLVVLKGERTCSTVGILVLLETPEDGATYTIATMRPRLSIGAMASLEIPVAEIRGERLLYDTGDASVLATEAGINLGEDAMVDLTAASQGDGAGGQLGVWLSPPASDEAMRLFLCRKAVSIAELQNLVGRLSRPGSRLVLLPYSDLITARDSKTLCAMALYSTMYRLQCSLPPFGGFYLRGYANRMCAFCADRVRPRLPPLLCQQQPQPQQSLDRAPTPEAVPELTEAQQEEGLSSL